MPAANNKLRTDPKDAAQDMAVALDGVFKNYSFQSRKVAWEGLIKGQGKSEIEKLLVHPTKPVNQIRKLTFKEWLSQDDRSV